MTSGLDRSIARQKYRGDALHLRTAVLNALLALTIAGSIVQFTGCQQKMADQPSYRPLEASSFFADGRSARPRVPGTVSQDSIDTTALINTGRSSESDAQNASASSNSLGGHTLENYSTQFPFPIDLAELRRGQERYTIFCAVCHGPTGQGDGPVVERGYTQPPSYLIDDSRGLKLRGIHMSLREVPVEYLFTVVSKGFGAMADYSTQVSVHDRWDIVAYIRTLQFSQQTSLKELPSSQQEKVQAAMEAIP